MVAGADEGTTDGEEQVPSLASAGHKHGCSPVVRTYAARKEQSGAVKSTLNLT